MVERRVSESARAATTATIFTEQPPITSKRQSTISVLGELAVKNVGGEERKVSNEVKYLFPAILAPNTLPKQLSMYSISDDGHLTLPNTHKKAEWQRSECIKSAAKQELVVHDAALNNNTNVRTPV